MKSDLEKQIQDKLEQWTTVFEGIKGCSLSWPKADRLLIASPTPVPWGDSLKPQYNESKYKIGYIMPKKTCLGLYIDFPKETLTYENVYQIIDPNNRLNYVPQSEKAPFKRSWWRFRTDEGFNSIHMVIHSDRLEEYDINRKEMKELLHHIVRLSNG